MPIWWQYFSGSCRRNSEQGAAGYQRSSSKIYISSFLIYYSPQLCSTEEIITGLQAHPADLLPDFDFADDNVPLDQNETEASQMTLYYWIKIKQGL